ncbi:hypothetical protein BTJ49_13425 [Oleiagrimonas sp. MCCC 1A03011]|nr:hypothetical protein BTJ49_13425 [Oleiagrimonas sp. MCCC 1A03011]
MRREFQTTFHSTLWELYLFQILKSIGLNIDWSKNRPDFIAKGQTELNVEAVVSEIKQGGRPEADRGFDDLYSMIEPPWEDTDYQEIIAEAITRYSNSILSKQKKYVAQYSKLDWVKNEVPFVIGVSSYSQVRYGKEYHYPMVALLYGKLYDPRSDTYVKEAEIIKPGTTAGIPLGIFQSEDMKCVSAILFSCTVTLGKLASLAISDPAIGHPTNYVLLVRYDYEPPHYKIQEVSPETPEDLFDGLFVFHNPNADHELPRSLFDSTSAIQVWESGGGLYFEGGDLPVVARLNLAKMLVSGEFKNMLLQDIFNRFNSEWLRANSGG